MNLNILMNKTTLLRIGWRPVFQALFSKHGWYLAQTDMLRKVFAIVDF